MKRSIIVALITLIFCSCKTTTESAKILLIPLDDRPSSWQFPSKMANVANAEVTTPPKELLGHFFTAGDSDKLQQWIKDLDLAQYDAVVVALDMLAYSGLVGSRQHNVEEQKALERLNILNEIRERAPDIKIYAQNVVMRLALTYNSDNSSYYSSFTKWATLSDDATVDEQTIKNLEKEIPEETIQDYLLTRQRNLQVNLTAIDMVRRGVIDFLVLSQDDASPQGLHVKDQRRLAEEIEKQNLKEKIIILPGADEVVMLLLSRCINEKYNQISSIKAIYSSEEQKEQVMPFQDTKLSETVSQHIFASHAREANSDETPDVYFFVYSSRNIPGLVDPFIQQIEEMVEKGENVIVADVDPIGNIQGGDIDFTTKLINKGLLSKLAGYASWNTAGNTIGTALPHGLIFTVAKNNLFKNKETVSNVLTAQNWFLLHRLMDDYYYHTLVRKQLNEYLENEGRSSTIMNDSLTYEANLFACELMQKHFDESIKLFENSHQLVVNKTSHCTDSNDFHFELPWNRTFEAFIDFDITCNVE